MQNWKNKLKGCFGGADKKFGRHALDEQRAKELKKELDSEGITWAQVEIEIKNHLDGCAPDHLQTELKEAKRLLCFGEERK